MNPTFKTNQPKVRLLIIIHLKSLMSVILSDFRNTGLV